MCRLQMCRLRIYIHINIFMYLTLYIWSLCMSHNTHEGIRNLSHVSSISLALLFFYFIIRYQHEALLDFQEIY